ncbi:MAG: PEP/pyruvate-binding domain-containing protein [Verrucomicrobiaceae bacterium]
MMTSPFVVPLSEARELSLTGGKAINLAKLMAADLPVPDGFVVTTTAYRAAGGSTAVPPDIEAEIRAAYEAMGSPMVAARSSATAEDMAEASMAGQYETFLNLSGADELLKAVSGCWESMRSDRLLSYLREQGIDPATVAMAVVVQKLVPAEAAGVLFTANPQTGATEDMLIEAAWGLGEGVVSGAVQPDRIRLRGEDGRVLKYEVAEKTTKLSPGGKGFEGVPRDDQSRACIQHEEIQELWQLGRRAARHFDGPQDIEWAVEGGKVYLLQSRAITTLREAALRHGLPDVIRGELASQIEQERGPWVRHNLDETLSHPTPLTWSLIRQFMSGAGGFGEMHREVGFEPSKMVCEEGFLELIGGRVYMDCARMPEMFSEGYPFAYDVAHLRADPDAAQQAPTLAKGSIRERGAAAAQAQKVTANLHELAGNLDKRFDEEFVTEVEAWCQEEAGRDLGSLDRVALAELWESRRRKVLDEFGVMAFLPSLIEALGASDLLAFLEEFSWDEDPHALMNRLVVSETADQTLRSNERLQLVGQGKVSREDWLKEFGFRGPGEFDLANPRWHERPGDLDAMASRMADEDSLGELHARRQREAGEALARLAEKLSDEKRDELKKRVELASRYVRFREDGKCLLMRAYAMLRPVALEIGERLGIGDEVFLLENGEMLEALATGYVPKDRIADRRLQRRAEAGLSLARVIDGDDLETLGIPAVDADASCWDTHSLSAGVCTGAARVVLSPESAGDLGKDYILVCPSTDPSWTPLFVGAAGLILECGGALSHGAIVARELGLPAVVLENATQLFEGGEELTLDANQGRVIRGAGSASPFGENDDPRIERALQPPLPGTEERKAGRLGVMFGLGWSVLLLAVWFLPTPWLQDPLFGFLDVVLWPLVKGIGMPLTVAAIAVFFAVVPLLLQKRFTDNPRLLVARDRAAALRAASGEYAKGSVRKEAMGRLAAPVTMRILKAAMTSLAFVLGPMMLIFLWLPSRLDPASWNAEPGQIVSVLAEVEGDWPEPLTLEIPEALEMDSTGKETQTLPPIRETLKTIRGEWAMSNDTSGYPWELQASAAQSHQQMLASLDRFLARPTEPQKISWRVNVPADAAGVHLVKLKTGDGEPTELKLSMGKFSEPALAETIPGEGPVLSLKAIYPRALQKRSFWAPFPSKDGEPYDFGWLGVYLIAYLPTMIVVKKVLRVA